VQILKNKANEEEVIKTYNEATAKAWKTCPKCHYSENPFQLFGDATWYLDGEDVKWCNIKCQGTDSSPCSVCSSKEAKRVKAGLYTPSPSPKKPPAKKPKSEFAQAEGFNKLDYERGEETPKKLSANACKWCELDPCVIDDKEIREGGRTIVKNLKANGETALKRFVFPICRMHARQLGCIGKRHILPCCVCLFVENNFVSPGEKRTDYKDKQR